MSPFQRRLGEPGLDRYACAFEANGVDMPLLLRADEQVLRQIDVASATMAREAVRA